MLLLFVQPQKGVVRSIVMSMSVCLCIRLLSLCLSVCSHAELEITTRPKCTSGFMGDVTFLHTGEEICDGGNV